MKSLKRDKDRRESLLNGLLEVISGDHPAAGINGDPILRRANEPNLPSLLDRVNTAVNGLTTTSASTATHREALTLAQQQVGPLLERLRKMIEVDLANVEKQMNALGAPWTPGRIPQ